MKHITKLHAAILIAAFISAPVSRAATFVEVDYQTAGDGLLIRDTVSGREWIDVAKTINMSVNDFLNMSIFAGGGFQIATFSDLQAFYTNAGATTLDLSLNPAVDAGISYHAGNYAAALQLQVLMEHSSPWSQTAGNPWIHGYVDYGAANNLALSRFMISGTTASFGLYTNGNSWTRDTHHNQIGIWAFRDGAAVPDDGMTIGLLGLGMVAVACFRRRLAS